MNHCTTSLENIAKGRYDYERQRQDAYTIRLDINNKKRFMGMRVMNGVYRAYYMG